MANNNAYDKLLKRLKWLLIIWLLLFVVVMGYFLLDKTG